MKGDRRRLFSLAWAMETLLALWIALAVIWLWPRLNLPRLGREEIWFGLGWLLALTALSAYRNLAPTPSPSEPRERILTLSACHWCAFGGGLLFVGLLLAGEGLGNYKLWLGIVYLGGVFASLAGLSLWVRERLLTTQGRGLRAAVFGAGLSFFGGLLLLPWISPELAAAWPPEPGRLLRPALASLLWGGISASFLLFEAQAPEGRRLAWVLYLALGVGMCPALAMTWSDPLYLAAAFLVMGTLAVLRFWRAKPSPLPANREPAGLPAYWMLRSLMLLWWGLGMAITLAAAWWRPQVEEIFIHSLWLRALVLGGFLVGSAGLLAEYSLPLLGRTGFLHLGRERKVLGLLFSAAALLAALTPLFLIRPQGSDPTLGIEEHIARADLTQGAVTLSPDNPELSMEVPSWLLGVNRIFVISALANAINVEQGAVLAQLTATDDQGLPHIYILRAGVDTAEWALDRRDVAAHIRHQAANTAQSWTRFTAEGEAFQAHDYYTGLFLGREVGALSQVRIRYLYDNPDNESPVEFHIKRVFVY